MSKLLIIGCGRSGTNSIADALSKLLGNDAIGHEHLGTLGMASWLHAIDTSITPPSFPDKATPTCPLRQSELPKYYNDDVIIVHQVRDPIAVINSLKSFKPESWQYIHSIFPDISPAGTLEDSIKYYILWNQAAEKNAVFTYRVEDLRENGAIFEKFATAIGHPEIISQYSRFKTLPQNINSRSNRWNVTFDDIQKKYPQLAEDLKALVTRYGYNIENTQSVSTDIMS